MNIWALRHNFPSRINAINEWTSNQDAKGERLQPRSKQRQGVFSHCVTLSRPKINQTVQCYGEASGCHRRRSLRFGRRQTLRRPRITVRVPSFWAGRRPGRHVEVFGAHRQRPLHRPTGPFQHVQKSQVRQNKKKFKPVKYLTHLYVGQICLRRLWAFLIFVLMRDSTSFWQQTRFCNICTNTQTLSTLDHWLRYNYEFFK